MGFVGTCMYLDDRPRFVFCVCLSTTNCCDRVGSIVFVPACAGSIDVAYIFVSALDLEIVPTGWLVGWFGLFVPSCTGSTAAGLCLILKTCLRSSKALVRRPSLIVASLHASPQHAILSPCSNIINSFGLVVADLEIRTPIFKLSRFKNLPQKFSVFSRTDSDLSGLFPGRAIPCKERHVLRFPHSEMSTRHLCLCGTASTRVGSASW